MSDSDLVAPVHEARSCVQWFSLTGGFIELLMLIITIFFAFYNYRLNDYNILYHY